MIEKGGSLFACRRREDPIHGRAGDRCFGYGSVKACPGAATVEQGVKHGLRTARGVLGPPPGGRNLHVISGNHGRWVGHGHYRFGSCLVVWARLRVGERAADPQTCVFGFHSTWGEREMTKREEGARRVCAGELEKERARRGLERFRIFIGRRHALAKGTTAHPPSLPRARIQE